MGKVVVPIHVLSHTGSRQRERLEALVDTGATLSMIPGTVLRRLGIRPTDRMAVRLADACLPRLRQRRRQGRVVRRQVGEARLRVDGHLVTSRVIFGKPHDATVLGLVVLESLGLRMAPSTGKLVQDEVLLLATDH